MHNHLDFLLSNECFQIIDSPSSHFQLTIKEAMETDNLKNATKTLQFIVLYHFSVVIIHQNFHSHAIGLNGSHDWIFSS